MPKISLIFLSLLFFCNCSKRKDPDLNRLLDKFMYYQFLHNQELEDIYTQGQTQADQLKSWLLKMNPRQVQDKLESIENLKRETSSQIELIQMAKMYLEQEIQALPTSLDPDQTVSLQNTRVRNYFIEQEKGYELILRLEEFIIYLNKEFAFLDLKPFERISGVRADFVEENFGETIFTGAWTTLTQLQIKILQHQNTIFQNMYYCIHPQLEAPFLPLVLFSPIRDTLSPQDSLLWVYYGLHLDIPGMQMILQEDTVLAQKGVATFTLAIPERDSLLWEAQVRVPGKNGEDTTYKNSRLILKK